LLIKIKRGGPEMSAWNTPADFASVCRRAGGRRRYNAQRRAAAWRRRQKILTLVEAADWYTRVVPGVLGELAERLGVSRATVCRDLQALRSADWSQLRPLLLPLLRRGRRRR
jgi:hypothetical protein